MPPQASAYRTALTGPATPTHDYTIDATGLVFRGEYLFGWFLNDSVGDNFNWPINWNELAHIQCTTNSMDLWLGWYGPCTGAEGSWTFNDDSGVSKLLGGITVFRNLRKVPLWRDVLTGLRVFSAFTDSNQTSPWSQATASIMLPAGVEMFGVMGHDLFPSTNNLVVTISGSDSLGTVYLPRDKLDDPFAGPSSGFEHIGTVTGIVTKSGANVITLTGTCSDGTVPAARGIIFVALNVEQAPRTKRPHPLTAQFDPGEDAFFEELNIKGWW